MIFGDVDMFDALLGEVIDSALVARAGDCAPSTTGSKTPKQKRGATQNTTFYGSNVSICAFSSIRC